MKNFKLISTFFALLLVVSCLSAQSKVGAKIEYGINQISAQSKYLVSSQNNVEYQISVVDITPSQSIGLYSNFTFGYLFLQPELLYTSYSVKYQIENFTDSQNNISAISNASEKIQQLDVPVYAGILIKNFKIGAGPVFHIAESLNSELTNYENIQVNPTKLSAGFQAGIGYNFKNIALDVKYQRDFNQVSDHVLFYNNATGLKSSLQGIRIGIAFAIGK